LDKSNERANENILEFTSSENVNNKKLQGTSAAR